MIKMNKSKYNKDEYFEWKKKQPNREELISNKMICAYCGNRLKYTTESGANEPLTKNGLAFCSKRHLEFNDRINDSSIS